MFINERAAPMKHDLSWSCSWKHLVRHGLMLGLAQALPVMVLAAPSVSSAAATPLRGEPATNMAGIAWGFLTDYQFGYKGEKVDYSKIALFIQQLGGKPAIIHGFFPWKRFDGTYNPFPADFADYALKHGAMPLITWPPGQADVNNQVEDFNRKRPQPDFDTVAIASGEHDAYIAAWADAAKAYPHTIYVRLMHEVLGTPYTHAFGMNRNTDPAQYVAAYRHVVDIFHRKNAANVQFVWCFGCGPENPPFEAFYPGDDYCEWVSLDGYNPMGREKWKTFEFVFGWEYKVLERISRRPILIGEIGSVEAPGDPNAKAKWISEALLDVIPKKMPRIKAVVFFNSGGNTQLNYHVDSSPETFAAYKAIVAHPLYQAPAPERPLLYESSGTSALVVNCGTGSGWYAPGSTVQIKAVDARPGKEFAGWIVSSGTPEISEPNSANTTVKMSGEKAELTATYRDASGQTHALTAKGACSGTGKYQAGSIVHIGADKAPEGQLFRGWVVESGNANIANVNQDNTTIKMPAADVVIAATYEPAPLEKYWLELGNGTGGQGWMNGGSLVEIEATPAPQGQVFDKWVVDYGNAVLADEHAPKTTFLMPKTKTRILGTYKPGP